MNESAFRLSILFLVSSVAIHIGSLANSRIMEIRPEKMNLSIAKIDTVKEGLYELINNGHRYIKGYYKADKRDSVWNYYNFKGNIVSKKIYSAGVKNGIWQFFTLTGEPEWNYDFGTATATYQSKPKTGKSEITYKDDQGNWVSNPNAKAPLVLRSNGEWYTYLNLNLHYPMEALSNNEQGDITVLVTVNENGDPVDYAIGHGISPALNAEALRVVKGFDGEYVPAEINGKKLVSRISELIRFKLEKR
jgi:TonB family protein